MRNSRFAGLAAIALAASSATASVVVPGNLVIMQLGDGTNPLADAGAVVKLRELTPAGGSVQTATLPSSGSSSLVINGTAVSEGFLTLHEGHIGVAGYVADAGTPSLPGTPSSAVPRHMSGYSLSQDLAGAPAYDATTTTLHSGGNMRSAVVSTTAGGFYNVGSGSNNALTYLANGASGAAGTHIAGLNGNRMVDIVGGNIYASVQAGSRGIYTVAGLPTASSTSSIVVATPAAGNGGTAVSINAFWLSPDLQTAYVADANTASNPGVKKYVLNSGTGMYDLAYSINTDYDGAGPATGEARYLAVDDSSGDNPLIYVVSDDGSRLLRLLDLGGAATSEATLTTLALADANTEFRGVVVTPVPEPAAVGLGFLGGLLTLARRRRRI